MLHLTLRSFRPRRRSAASSPALNRVLSGGLVLALAFAPFRTVHAGDILRGGGVSGPSRAPAISGANGATTNEVGAAGRDTLARTTQALQAVRAMQNAARNAAISGPNNLGLNPNQPGVQLPNVPNGLTTGGLQVAPKVPVNPSVPVAGEDPSLWQGASLPVQTTASNGRTQVNITQNKQQALLNWQTFNVGKETSVTFDQTAGGQDAGQWIAFNKINDPSGVPSQILGSIDAVGQIYLINQNGIIFGGSSQINLHTLVASALPINDTLVSRGLLNNPDLQFLFSSLPIPALPNGGTMPAFTPPAPPNTPGGKLGAVTVQPGAILNSPTTADHVGGRVALLGPDVTNAGTISTPDGQTILAAGQQVALTAHSSNDPTLRGLDVFIGQVEADRGIASNSGLIEAPRGNVTMAGQLVDQLGGIDSSTSVSLNGRIDLLANYNTVQVVDAGRNVTLSPTASGNLTLGASGITQVVPELASTERVVGTQLALRSQVNLQGLALHLEDEAQLFAPSATVTLNAGRWLPANIGFAFVFDRGQVYLDAGAMIDVSGSLGVEASVGENIIELQLRGAELANFSLQRNGPLRGQTIRVDIRDTGTYNGQTWIGTPLADVSGYVNLVQRTVGELTTTGGTVSINAGNSVVLQPGSGIDVSGGSIDYQGALVQTTKVISGGNIFDIAQATPDRIYTGIYNGSTTVHPKWGITETNSSGFVNNAQFEPGYIQGANGGTLSITAPSMALDGALLGSTVSGSHQRITPPVAGTLALAFQAQTSGPPPFTPISPTPPNISFQSGVLLSPADAFALDASGNPLPLRADRLVDVILSPDLLTTGGFGNLKIVNSDGKITVPASTSLTTAPGGSIAFTGANIDIEGQVIAPGGALAFTSLNISPALLVALSQDPNSVRPPPDPTRGNFVLGVDAMLSTAGLITDQRQTPDALDLRPFTQNGGSIKIASYNVDLAHGSITDVSGGVIVDATAKATYGTVGAITINAGQDPGLASILGGRLNLGTDLRGFSGGVGGTLSILAPLIRVDGAAAATPNSATLTLQPEFFSQGGFNRFVLTGLGAPTTTEGEYLTAIIIASGTTVAPVVESLLVNLDLPDAITLDRTNLPLGVRSQISLSFNASGVTDPFARGALLRFVRGDLIMGEGAIIRVDPGGKVELRGDTAAVLGSIIAPGGAITISGGGTSDGLFRGAVSALPTVDLGPRSSLLLAGTTVLTPNSLGFRTGSVLAGGNITITGNIVAEAGSVLDVSGAAGVLDLAPGFSGSNNTSNPGTALLIPTQVESDAGSITFNGQQELFLDATLIGLPGGPSANGGSVFATSDRFVQIGSSDPLTPLTTTLFVTQSGPTIPQPFYGSGENAIGHFVTGTSVRGGGHLAADSFVGHGIDSVALRGSSGIGATEFDGPVSLTVGRQISVTGGALFADAAVTLNAPYIKLGTDFQPPIPPEQVANAFNVGGQPFYFPPQFGPGTLTASGKLIDIGNLSLQGIGSTNLIAQNGDIRGNGTLNAAGAINLTAGQIYPTTETIFTIAADDYLASGFTLPGLITISPSGTRQTPLSAGGQLNVFASIIKQDGTLRAPIGTINLGTIGSAGLNPISNAPIATARQLTFGNGSVTSVSADGLTIPYGVNLNGTAWIDPAGVDITVGGVPGKSINLAAANLVDVAGSTIDTRGGGDLLAYRFVSGNGGTRDILASNSSFAIVPGYQADFAPIDPGYANSTLSVGDRVFLNGSDALPAGFYTLLPARYALLPGAVLITPKSGAPSGESTTLADGASVVAGYRFNDLNSARSGPPLNAVFEVAPTAVVQARAQYDLFSANTFLRDSALTHDAVPPRLPIDSGQLVLTASRTMTIQGAVVSQAPTGGRGGLVDINSPADILIGRAGADTPDGTLFLDAAGLSAFGAESLLIGGVRSATSTGTAVSVTTGNLIVDNNGSSLTSPELILVANESLTLAPGSQLAQTGVVAGGAETLLLGNESVAGSGDGLLVRLTSDPAAEIVRSGVDASSVPRMIVGAGARLTGTSLTLDSTSTTQLNPSAVLSASVIALNSGQITLQLGNSGAIRPTTGLILSGAALQTLQAGVQSLSFLSYSSIDIYGTGQLGATDGAGRSVIENLALHTGEIRGFNNQGGAAVFAARNILLDNSPNRSATAAFGGGLGTLQFNAETIRLGKNQLNIDQFSNVVLNASGAIIAQNADVATTTSSDPVPQVAGGLATAGNLTLRTALLTGTAEADQTLSANGALTIETPTTSATTSVTGGLGARLTLQGSRIVENSNIVLPSGSLTMRATLGDVSLGGSVDVAGQAQNFYDLVKYTSGGEVDLISDHGDVTLLPGSNINVSAQSGGGDAGSLSVSTHAGSFVSGGILHGVGGAGGRNGSFSLDAGQLGPLASLNQTLNAAAFTEARNFRVRAGDVVVDGLATAHLFNLSADSGSIVVTGTIDSSGVEGGAIALRASGSVTLAANSRLTVAAENFDAAGKGGAISLEAGSETNGTFSSTASLNLESGSVIDLSVVANTSASLGLGRLSGTLHLRAPQTPDGADVQIAAINSTIVGASSIVVEGYQLFDLTGTDGSLTSSVQNAVRSNGETFGAADPAMRARLLANNSGLSAATVIEPGAEIINRSGDLTLGSADSDPSADWDLSSFRFGPNAAPGDLTLRAAGDIVLYNALSDGFTSSAYNAELLAHNALRPANAQSWSYRIVSGADLSAADFHRVQALTTLAVDSGSLRLGKDYGINVFGTTGASASTAEAVSTRYQVIRTGTGDIDIVAGRDVQLLNQLATIFTAGTRVLDPTLGGTFDVPIPDASAQLRNTLGDPQQESPGYAPQYSYAGGNISISAQHDVSHLTRASDGSLVADSSRELPINWLYRRGYVDPATGEFGEVNRGNRHDIGSTTWWVDFSNFFEGIGTLGGGNTALSAGHDVSNVDAVAPTNARMPKGLPDAANLLELGGGNIAVRAGHDIDAGVYYVEHGQGTLRAGNSIHTNSTRSPSRGPIASPSEIYAPESWLPTTLFLGQGSFDVAARGDLLLGPTANPFLLPEGINNTFWYKTYFSTYAPESAVRVASLTGNVTLRQSATANASDAGSALPVLEAWLDAVSRFESNGANVSFYQPWLRLADSQVAPFATLSSVNAPTLQATAFSGDLNIAGNFSLFPSPTGTLDLAAREAINGVQRNGSGHLVQNTVATFGESQINLSDADPARIPSIANPFAYRSTLLNPTIASQNQTTNLQFLAPINLSFSETGSTVGTASVLQTKQALHASGLLHLDDPTPLHVYAGSGDVSGLTLFAGKPLRLISGRDITDIALFIQNNHADDITLVAAGRDLIAYDPNSQLRVEARLPGNVLNLNAQPASGDLQINGPGTLEVLAGRNFDLGVGPSNSDRTGLGATSIGNARNPNLPFAGADIVGGAGLGASSGLGASQVHFADFEGKFLDPQSGGVQTMRYLPELGKLLSLTNASDAQVWDAFQQLPAEQQDNFALQIFYLVLRDAGRDRNNPDSPGFGNYDAANQAIAALFPGDKWRGDISLTSREIKTANSGNVSLFAPGGQLTVGFDIAGTQAADQGILTEHGGDISIYTKASVVVGTSRIFTLRGGNEIIFSHTGDIAAGASSKTVQSAPPTRVLIDPQSGDVKTDLAGLATGGGIGVLNTVAGVPPGDVDLIAPAGTVDAGDAGIRVSGNLNIAAVQVLNAGNIQTGGSSVGTSVVAAPNLGNLTAASSAAGAQNSTASETGPRTSGEEQQALPSIITVEVLGYGGGEGDRDNSQDEEDKRRRRKEQEQAPQGSRRPVSPVIASSRS